MMMATSPLQAPDRSLLIERFNALAGEHLNLSLRASVEG